MRSVNKDYDTSANHRHIMLVRTVMVSGVFTVVDMRGIVSTVEFVDENGTRSNSITYFDSNGLGMPAEGDQFLNIV